VEPENNLRFWSWRYFTKLASLASVDQIKKRKENIAMCEYESMPTLIALAIAVATPIGDWNGTQLVF
jgi:hypothetical protein